MKKPSYSKITMCYPNHNKINHLCKLDVATCNFVGKTPINNSKTPINNSKTPINDSITII